MLFWKGLYNLEKVLKVLFRVFYILKNYGKIYECKWKRMEWVINEGFFLVNKSIIVYDLIMFSIKWLYAIYLGWF